LYLSPCTENTGKFKAKWIGPYVVSEKMEPGAYRLSDTQGRVLEHSWNVENHHCFYIEARIVSRGLETINEPPQ
jgi:hypothetical protein